MYTSQVLFQIKAVLGNNSYEVQSCNYTTSGICKYKEIELYILPSVVFPQEPIDTMETKFINYSNAPIVSLLQKYLNIQLYNDHFFKTNSPSILQPSIDRPSNPIDEGYFKSHTPHANQLPTIKQLYHATNASACHIEEIPFSPAVLTHLQIQESKHKLLFIKFAPVSTIRPFWCLVQVDLDITLDLYPDTPPNNMHYYVFLAKHPNDIHKSY